MNEMIRYDPKEFEGMNLMAAAMVKSGFFKDANDVSKAIVKIQAGRELGLPAFASMTGIHIIQGKPILGSNVIATLVKNDPRYNYTIKQCDDKACVLGWYEDGQAVGESAFTWEEAKTAGLTGKDNWKKYASDMLFARAISRGARRFAPGVFGGSPVYTPDEFGVEVDPEGYIETTAVEVTEEKADQPEGYPDETIQAVMDAGLAQHFSHAVNMLNKSDLPTDCAVSLAVDWCKGYRARRDGGKDTETAATETNDGLAKMLEKNGNG